MKNNIYKATILVSLMTILSKPLGFIREAIIAAYFGASSQTDAFFLAQNMPGLIFPAVCMSLSTAFLTVYVSKSVEEGKKAGDIFASSAIIFNLLISIILSGIAFIFAPIIVRLLAPGFESETIILAIKLTRMVMTIFSLLMFQYMLNAVLNGRNFYIGSQISGVIYNIVIIVSVLTIGNKYGVFGLTVSFILGYIIQSIVLAIIARRRFKFNFSKYLISTDIKHMIRLSLPILLGNSVIQLNNIVDKVLASSLTEGSVSALSYTNTLNSFVISIIITSLITVLYPTMTEFISKGDENALVNMIASSLIMLFLILIPVTIITFIFSNDIVNIAYGRGNFGEEAITLTSKALKYYSLGFIFIAIREISTKIFYAYKDTKTPMINGVISVVLNIIFSIILSKYMGIVGIALGTTMALIISSFLFYKSIRKKIPLLSLKKYRNSVYKIIFSGIITVISMCIIGNIIEDIRPIIRFTIVTIIGFTIYFGSLLILGCNEVNNIINFMRKRLNK